MAAGETKPTAALNGVLTEAQRLGFLGARPIDEVIVHARAFVDALVDLSPHDGALRVVDLGSGGGVPGLVIAVNRPDAELLLVDRREKRTDFLSRAVSRLGLTPRVEVRCGDVAQVVADSPDCFDAVVARGFGPPTVTLGFAVSLVRPGGRVVISEPPAGDRWDADELRQLGLVHRDRRSDGARVAVFDRI